MKINAIQALRGPNYWSTSISKLIQLRLEFDEHELMDVSILQQLDQVLSLRLNNINDLNQLPVVIQVAQRIGSLALKLQQEAGSAVEFLIVRETKFPTIANVVFEYENEATGKQAAISAVKWIESILVQSAFNIEKEKQVIQDIFIKESPNADLAGLMQKAKQLNIPVIAASDEGSLQLGYGIYGMNVDLKQLPLSIGQGKDKQQELRIPIIAVTGSNGKTTTTRLIAHLVKMNGQHVGYTTSDGIYINGKMIDEGDTTGPISAEVVLRNKDVEVAVLETARGGIVRAGLGFDQCDVAVVTNVQDDHLGISDIETMEELAKVKSVIVNVVKSTGYAILNADNPFTVAMGNHTHCKIAWFSMDSQNPIILNAQKNGLTSAFVQNNEILIQVGSDQLSIAKFDQIPLTFNGTLGFMVQNVMAASLAAFVFGINPQTISAGLSNFYPSAEQTPGRMNIFEWKNGRIMVDFAHNPDGFRGIRDFLATVESPYKIGIIVGTGDRKEEDVRELGRLSAAMFDHILIHQVKFLRGKSAQRLVDLLVEGITSVDSAKKWERVADEIEPLEYAISIAPPDSFITALSDVLNDPIQLIQHYKESNRI